MESCAVKKSSNPLETHCDISNNESVNFHDGPMLSSNLNYEIQDEGVVTMNESSAQNLLLTFRQKALFARRKLSTCSNGSSTNSTCHSLDEGSSGSEIISNRYNSDSDSASVGIDKYDDIIDRIVDLNISLINNDVESKDACVITNEKQMDSECGRTGKLSENIPNGNNKNEPLANGANVMKNVDLDVVNGNYEGVRDNEEGEHQNDVDDDDSDLVERGPVRPHNNVQSHHEKPYYTLNWVASTRQNVDNNQLYESDYDCVNEIVQNKQLYDKLNPYIDKLSKDFEFNQSYLMNGEQPSPNDFNAISGWSTPEFNYAEAGTPSSSFSGDDTFGNCQIAPKVPSEGESILEKLTNGAYQPAAAQSMSDLATSYYASPGAPSSEHWPDSPASARQQLEDNVPSSSRSHSRASSRAQSPGSSFNIGSPLLHQNAITICPQSQPNVAGGSSGFRFRQTLSSSESSNHSFGDTWSPLSYEYGIDHKTEQQLDLEFDNFSMCFPNYMSSDTLVNTSEIIDAIVNNEIAQCAMESGIIKSGDECDKVNEFTGDTRVVRKTQIIVDNYEPETSRPGRQDICSQGKQQNRTIDNIIHRAITSETSNESMLIGGGKLNYSGLNGGQEQLYPAADVSQLRNMPPLIMNDTASNNIIGTNIHNVDDDLTYSECMRSNNFRNTGEFATPAENPMNFVDTIENLFAPRYVADSSTMAITNAQTINDSIASIGDPDDLARSQSSIDVSPINPDSRDNYFHNKKHQPSEGKISESPFNEFQIPERTSAYRQNHLRRYSERHVAPPWPSLNLPETAASERLKAGLDAREVEKAMKDLLKRPPGELAAVDEDGDTMLMCLVGNPGELEKKKAYLVPLVERLGNIAGSLTMRNNRNEDALYIAAMYCPQMAYVTGYLAAVMLQKNIDISQRLYHGDSLVHIMAAKGDTHAPVLAELLSLKTAQGNAVFDLSQRNYTGRTPLHVAVESHDPTGSGINCISVTQLLLQNGANQKIQDIERKNTALHTAVSLCRDPALVKTLLSNNGNELVNMPNCMNNTPVHLAFALPDAIPISRQIQVCMDLIEAGGETNIRNGQGRTPFALISTERRETMKNIFFKKKKSRV